MTATSNTRSRRVCMRVATHSHHARRTTGAFVAVAPCLPAAVARRPPSRRAASSAQPPSARLLYSVPMKLDAARLCLDCDEIHEEQICPSCSSEAFAFLTRWVKTSGEHRVERRAAPVVQPATTVHPARTPEQIEAFRQLIEGKPEKGPGRESRRPRASSALAAVSLLGWAWRSRTRADGPGSDSERSGSGPAPSSGPERGPRVSATPERNAASRRHRTQIHA